MILMKIFNKVEKQILYIENIRGKLTYKVGNKSRLLPTLYINPLL